MPEIADYKIFYLAGESEAGKCPVCGNGGLEYKPFEVIDGIALHPWNCKACGASGKEYGKIVFDGHEVNRREKSLE